MSEAPGPGEWAWHAESGQACRVLEVQELWGTTVCDVWLPGHGTVLRVPSGRLFGLEEAPIDSALDRLSFAAAAARIADALERDGLVAPLQGTLIPLPHQIEVLARAVSGDRVRYLLADEVGLGKTIEAGLILRELKYRGLVRRTLVVVPAGLMAQWVAELRTHFGEDFRIVRPEDLRAWRELSGVQASENLWRLHDQVICPLDSVKPVDGRRGWSAEQLAGHNRERFEDLVTAGWDLVIVDEAHRLSGGSEQVARFRLGQALCQATPYVLLLSATPHQGKTDAFRRLIGFLDSQALPDDESVRRENVTPFVIRTEKRRAIDAQGKPLFRPRRTQLVPVAWESPHREQKALYEAVTEYVREGYDRALREKRTAVSFLMILMQRLVTSSTAAIRTALERRLAALELPPAQLPLFPDEAADEWGTLDGQEQMELVLRSRIAGLHNERAEVELLLSTARRCETRGPDAKAEALLAWIQRLGRDEGDAGLKVLVFTEFVPTQAMLAEFLESRGLPAVRLNGSMDMAARREAQRAFTAEAQILVSTDAGGEGLNLQFCHVVVNYDLPWNPMKLEQRIGRVDRIGQRHVVRALNFALEDTVELRVREVLEDKLALILKEFGVDKLSDVLDSEEEAAEFEQLFVGSVLAPRDAEDRALALAELLRERARAVRQGTGLLGAIDSLDPKAAQQIASHPLPFWTERMTIAFLRSQKHLGGDAAPGQIGYRLCWPDGEVVEGAVFSLAEAERPGATLVSLEDPRVRGLLSRLPHAVPGQPLAVLDIAGISDKVSGWWSLWRVALQSDTGRQQRILPVFVSDQGRALPPTARTVWDLLVEASPETCACRPDTVATVRARSAFETSLEVAREQGQDLFAELREAQGARLGREQRKMEHAFEARRRALGRIGLPQVHSHRIARLAEEERRWRSDFAARQAALPELFALVLVRVAPLGEP